MKARSLAVVVFSLGLFLQSHATPLNLAPSGPDFFANYLTVSYAAGVFDAQGWTEVYSDGTVGMTADYDDMSFSLSANIDINGYLSSGLVTIMGDVGSGNEVLLTGALNAGSDGAAFGSYSPTGRFEFKFTVTGVNSSIVSDFGGMNAQDRGIILHLGGGTWDGSWETSFANDGTGVADTFGVVPEPSSILLLACGGAVWMAAVRRRK